jgi:Ca-activated chloride channel family protein
MESAQATEQWLRQIPDDPGGLLRRKFEYEYQKKYGRGRRRANSW